MQILDKVVLSFDIFGRDMDSQHIGIKLFKTYFGTILSMLFMGMLLNYTIYKL